MEHSHDSSHVRLGRTVLDPGKLGDPHEERVPVMGRLLLGGLADPGRW